MSQPLEFGLITEKIKSGSKLCFLKYIFSVVVAAVVKNLIIKTPALSPINTSRLNERHKLNDVLSKYISKLQY
jgi:hypothetical protein